MKNTLQDLNNHLFEQLERLNDDDLTGEQLDQELRRADGMSKIASQIIQNGNLAFKVVERMAEYGYRDEENAMPAMLSMKAGGSD